MIDPLELRIGNLVNIGEDAPYTITGKDLYELELYLKEGEKSSNKFIKWAPIIINQEMLFRIGFLIDEDDETREIQYVKNNIVVTIVEGYIAVKILRPVINAKGELIDEGSIEIVNSKRYYIHHLQNLCIAIKAD